jgi:methylase of polypeptide subunit release factors
MRNNSNGSAAIETQDFPMPWVTPGPRTFADHAKHVANIAKPQPPASINGVELFLPPNVYHPGVGLSSRFLVEAVANLRLGGSVLDLGCGSGFVGISVYRPGMDLVLADISDPALASAAENLRRTGITAELVSSDLFMGLRGRRFDTILFNPPLFDKVIEHDAEIALCDAHGELLSRFLAGAPDHLTSVGTICFTASNLMNRDALTGGLQAYQFEIISSSLAVQSEVARWVICATPKRQLEPVRIVSLTQEPDAVVSCET